MSQLDLARLQFAMTSIYHFLFVPVTIGLAFLTALLQTSLAPDRPRRVPAADPVLRDAAGHQRRGRRGDRAGAGVPVRHELVGVLADGRRRVRRAAGDGGAGGLLPRVDVPRAVAVRLGQAVPPGAPGHDLGGRRWAARCRRRSSWRRTRGCSTRSATPSNPTTGRPQLNDIWAVMTNPVFLRGYLHVLLASLTTASVVMLAVSAWQLRRGTHPDVFRPAARLALVVLAPSVFLAMFVGSELGVIEAKYQPMKIAAAEAQWETCQPCSFSLFQIGGGNNDQTPTKIIADPAPAVAAGDEHVERPGAWGSTSCRRSTSSSTGRATTCRTCSSSTGRCG